TSDIKKEINVNLTGAIIAIKYALPIMAERNSRLITISSVWGVVGGSCESSYSASKGGLISFTKAIAKEMGAMGLTANCICPGLIKTKMNNHLKKEDFDAIKNETPLNTFATTHDIANLALFLASPKAKNITGQIITLDAGWTL
ncbi:MAG: SDR family oxidoreductase, partial [Clostridia bacterium]|nr:SDR family oxidoreductase [Clostridia bacterium]